MSFDLRSFLRRTPKPRKLRIETSDGAEKTIELGEGRTRWHAAEETVRSTGAVKVECLDKDGNILRAQRLAEDDGDADDSYDAARKGEEKVLARDRAANAAMLDAYGRRLVEAFDAGSRASAQSQDRMLVLVETLTENLSAAIVNVHNMAVTHAQALQVHAEQLAKFTTQGDGEATSGAAMQILAGVMGAKVNIPPTSEANGAAKGKRP